MGAVASLIALSFAIAEILAPILPPVDFTEKMMVSFRRRKMHQNMYFLGNQARMISFEKLMWDAFLRQVAASAVRCADTPEETAARVQLLLASNPFPELPIVVFTTEAIAEPATGISVQVIHEAGGWQAALHALAGKPHSGAN